MQPANAAAQSKQAKDGLRNADDRIVASQWLPPQTGVVPRVSILFWWVNVLWAIPIGIVFLVIGIAVAQGLRDIPAVQQFIAAYPGQVSVPVYSGYPAWLRWQHFFNFPLDLFHHPLGHSDSRRSSPPLLEPELYSRHGMVPLPAQGSEGSGLDIVCVFIPSAFDLITHQSQPPGFLLLSIAEGRRARGLELEGAPG